MSEWHARADINVAIRLLFRRDSGRLPDLRVTQTSKLLLDPVNSVGFRSARHRVVSGMSDGKTFSSTFALALLLLAQ